VTEATRILSLLSNTEVGKVIAIQRFNRNGDDSIDPKSLYKAKGKFQGFTYKEWKKTLLIQLEGLPTITANLNSQLVECFHN
jgi:hypothetical protein